MRECLLVGFVALAFGLAARQLAEEASVFVMAHLIVGLVSLAAAGALGARRLRGAQSSAERGGVPRATLWVVATIVAAGVLIAAAERANLRLDLTFERRYELAEATVAALETLGPGLEITLYADPGDPRIRRTRLLLDQLGAVAGARVETKALSEDIADIDRYGIGSSNSVVLRRSDAPATQRYDWELVQRPSEGALFEALSLLTDPSRLRIYALVGTGEGDLLRTDGAGFSGLAAAIETEGYELVPLPSAFVRDFPRDAAAVLAIAPERMLAATALAALRDYLDRGGRLLAFLEPGRTTGLEALLGDYGLASPDALVVDPASADVDGAPPGLSPVAFHYGEHPITRGLDRNRVTFFQGARSFALRKPRPQDRLRGAVTTTGDAWLLADTEALLRPNAPEQPPGTRTNYQTLVAVGEYLRDDGRHTRIVAFGDSDVASNRFLRALFNLDLVMNSLHWLVEREASITLRPKAGATVQFPMPLQNSLRAFYGVGMLIPELLLLAGGLVWLRGRGA